VALLLVALVDCCIIGVDLVGGRPMEANEEEELEEDVEDDLVDANGLTNDSQSFIPVPLSVTVNRNDLESTTSRVISTLIECALLLNVD
jgi:hypothetical protein